MRLSGDCDCGGEEERLSVPKIKTTQCTHENCLSSLTSQKYNNLNIKPEAEYYIETQNTHQHTPPRVPVQSSE